MSTLPGTQHLKRQRKNTLIIFYVFVFLATGTFTVAVKASQATQEALFVLGVVLVGGGIWSFLRFLKVADTHQRLINHEATSFAFVGSLLLTLAVGILQRLGFLSGLSLLIPALMIALWSIGLIVFSWRYQE
jgi:uncharacterized protein involved in response to NO